MVNRKILRVGGEETFLPIPLPSSTLFLSKKEVQDLVEFLEASLPHRQQLQVAGEVLSREEVQALMDELRAEILKPEKKIPWETEGF